MFKRGRITEKIVLVIGEKVVSKVATAIIMREMNKSIKGKEIEKNNTK